MTPENTGSCWITAESELFNLRSEGVLKQCALCRGITGCWLWWALDVFGGKLRGCGQAVALQQSHHISQSINQSISQSDEAGFFSVVPSDPLCRVSLPSLRLLPNLHHACAHCHAYAENSTAKSALHIHSISFAILLSFSIKSFIFSLDLLIKSLW